MTTSQTPSAAAAGASAEDLHEIEVTIFVKYVSGAYSTNTVRGCRASSTMSASYAAHRLAEKLFFPVPLSVVETSEGTTYTRRFQARGILRAMPMTPAYRKTCEVRHSDVVARHIEWLKKQLKEAAYATRRARFASADLFAG
jgi:hypothetical protein